MRKIAITLFLYGIILAGGALAASALSRLAVADPIKFGCYCAITLFAARLKVRLPGIFGTMTVNYVFVLIGLADMTLAECMLASMLAAIVQCVAHAVKRPRPIHVAFNVGNVAIAVATCGAVFSSAYLRNHAVGLFLRLTLSAVAYFLVNTLSVAAIISLTESKKIVRVWRECYLWVFPFYFVGAGFAWVFHRLSAIFGWQAALLSLPGTYLMYAAYHFYLGRLQAEKVHAENIAALHLRTIEALAMAIDAKDETTHDHLQRVKVYASEIGKELKLSDMEMEALQAAAMLHDIGKLAVPEHIISKPGKLTPEEFEKMKIHPAVGAEILERANFPYPVAPIVRCHHEKWDGSGYPAGLVGEAIPIGARVLSAVDCLDALASDRQYRKALPLGKAMGMVAEQSGKAFDPKIIEILQRRYEELETMARAVGVPDEPKSLAPVVSRGDAPDAGFEETGVAGSENDKIGFLTSIAAARQEMQTLFELSADLGHSLGRSDTLSIFASKLGTIIPYDLICISAIQNDALHPEYAAGKESNLYLSMRIPVGEGLSGWVAQNNASVVNGNPSVEPGYLNDPTVITNLKSALAVPLEQDGSAIGVLSLYSSEKNAFSRDHLRILETMSPRLGAALSNDRKLTEAQDSAVTDFLTGLPNSRSLYLQLDAELARTRDAGDSLGILMCDLDGFKKVNDEHGHQEGDRALKGVAGALKESCRNCDYVARIGGDEFVIVLGDLDPSQLPAHVNRFRAAVERAGARMGFPGLSLSVGSMLPDCSVAADAILAEADRRMYRDKRKRKAARASAMDDIANLAASVGRGGRPEPATAGAAESLIGVS
jgi:diguanylate cyclase (GGDEF)-like protein/putative nucleotidyltransferase with HDIG domain